MLSIPALLRLGTASLGVIGLASIGLAQRPLEVTFLHTNDLHAHVEPVTIKGKSFGGYQRQVALLKGLRAKEKNTITLEGGDVFQGTLYFNVYEGLADASLMNLAGYDAMTLGNHEFDKGVPSLTAFTLAANFPIVGANVTFDKSKIANPPKVQPSVVLKVDGQQIGVIGAVTEDTPNISSPGEGVTFLDPYTSIQAEADRLTKAGINKIVVLSHLGYGQEKALAARLKNVDLIIGGHSHTLLGTVRLEGWPEPGGPYPTMVKAADGHNVPVVQAWEWGKVLGRLKVAFDAKGNLTRVVDAQVIPIDDTITPDPQALAVMEALAKPIAQVANEQVGTAAEAITDRSAIGHLLADALLEGGKPSGAVVGFMNPGGVRANLEAGKITYGAASSIAPFRNTLVVLDLKGSELLTALTQLPMFPSEGSSYRMEGGKPVDVIIAGKPLDPDGTYRIATLNFLANGGDSVFAFRDAKGYRVDTGKIDIDLWVDYLKAHPNLVAPPSRVRS